jgi:hypothetical protein
MTSITLFLLVMALAGSARPSRLALESSITVAEPGVAEVLFVASRIQTYTVLLPLPGGRVQGAGLLKGSKLVQVRLSDMHLRWIDSAMSQLKCVRQQQACQRALGLSGLVGSTRLWLLDCQTNSSTMREAQLNGQKEAAADDSSSMMDAGCRCRTFGRGGLAALGCSTHERSPLPATMPAVIAALPSLTLRER